MAIHVGEILNFIINVMLIAYVWYAVHHSTHHHPRAQAAASEEERPNIQGPRREVPKHEEPHIEDEKTEERVALLVEKAMQPIVQWHDAQKRADEAKIESMEIDQHAIMHRQKMFERVTETKVAQIRATQLAQEVRQEGVEERARTAAKKELTYQHQNETEELRRQLQNQQKKHQREEARTRGQNNAMSKVLGDVERLRVRVQEESQRRMEVEDKAEAKAADVARLISRVEDFHASLEQEKRRREQVERHLALENGSTGRVNATIAKLKMCIRAGRRLARRKRTDEPVRTINDQISRHAVATFRLHTAEPKRAISPKPTIPDHAFSDASSLDDAINRLGALSITNSKEKPVMSQQLVVHHPSVNPQQTIIPLQVVIDLPPTVSQQLVLHQPHIEQDSVVSQATIVDPEPIVDQTSAGMEDPSSDQETVVGQPLIGEPAGGEEPAGDVEIVMKEAPVTEKEPAHNPAPFALMEPAVIRQHLIEEEPVAEGVSLVLQQSGQDSDVSMSHGNNAVQEPTQQPPGEAVQEETVDKYGVLLVPHVSKPESDGSQYTHHDATPVADMGTAGNSSVNLDKIPPRGSQETSHHPRAIFAKQVDEPAENEDRSLLHPQPTALSSPVIGPISGVYWDSGPMRIFRGRHILPRPKRKKHKFSKDQIEKTKSKASEALPTRRKTLFSSEYLARLRARMADISVMRKLMGDNIDEDDDWVVQVRQTDQELGEAALCNMSEETQYAVPPYTKHMIMQMMESFFLACVWDSLNNEFDLNPKEEEDFRKSFMEAVKKHMNTHAADTLPVS